MFSLLYCMLLLRGNRRECLEEPREIGFLRDACVELGRNLIKKLKLPRATEPCQYLALTRTSTCWPFVGCKRWKWTDEKNKEAYEKVRERALEMVRDFNDHVSKYPKIPNKEDQRFIWKSVGITARRLIKSKVVENNSDLIDKQQRLTLRQSFQGEETFSITKEVIHNDLPDKLSSDSTMDTNNADGYGNEKEVFKPTEPDEKEDSPPHHLIQEKWEENIAQGQEKESGSTNIPKTSPQGLTSEKLTQEVQEIITQAENTARPKDTEDEQEQLLRMEARKKKEEAENKISKAFDYEERNFDYDENFPLHESAFQGNTGRLEFLLGIGYNVATKDKHDCMYVLLHHRASVRTRNLAGWSPLDEAISYGDRDTILLLWREFNRQFCNDMVEKRKKLLLKLKNTENFYIKLKWELRSYVPGLSRILPSDTYEVYKYGSIVKLDTTLYAFSLLKMKWDRSKVSYIFYGNLQKPTLFRIDYAHKECGPVLENSEKTEEELHKEVTQMMSEDLMSRSMLTENVKFTRSQKSGLYGFAQKKDKTELLGPYKSEFYQIDGLVFVQHKRTEHLSPEQIKHNNEMDVVENLANGLDIMALFHAGKEILSAPLSPVPDNKVTWKAYINAKPGEPPTLGRPSKPKETLLKIAPEIAMTSDFPISKELIVAILEVIAPFKHFTYLRDFMKIMPSGFPVQLEIPIKASIFAKYTFLECRVTEVPMEIFTIPESYKNVRYPSNGLTFFEDWYKHREG